MKSTTKTCMLVAIFASITLVGHVDVVEAGNNSWGWAKPLNQKPGSLLYTLNRKNHRKTTSRKTSSYRSYRLQTYTPPKFTTPAYDPHVTIQSPAVIIDSTPTTQLPKQPVVGRRVIPSQPRIVQPPVKTPSTLDGWLVP